METFPCKHRETEPDGTVRNCPEKAIYTESQIVQRNRPAAGGSKKTVYLECEAGHIYPYEVSVKAKRG